MAPLLLQKGAKRLLPKAGPYLRLLPSSFRGQAYSSTPAPERHYSFALCPASRRSHAHASISIVAPALSPTWSTVFIRVAHRPTSHSSSCRLRLIAEPVLSLNPMLRRPHAPCRMYRFVWVPPTYHHIRAFVFTCSFLINSPTPELGQVHTPTPAPCESQDHSSLTSRGLSSGLSPREKKGKFHTSLPSRGLRPLFLTVTEGGQAYGLPTGGARPHLVSNS